MPKREERESSTNRRAEIPDSDDLWRKPDRDPDPAIPVARVRRTKARGLLRSAEQWTETHPREASEAFRAFAKHADGSPSAHAIADLVAQLLTGDLMRPAPPIIHQPDDPNGVRWGFFHLSTDRDAFIEQLLGRPVPAHPRYARRPAIRGDVAPSAEEEESVVGREPLRSPRGNRRTAELSSAVRWAAREAFLDPALRAAAGDLAGRNPASFVELPTAKVLIGALENRPGWRRLDVGTVELSFTFANPPIGWVGFAFWLPGEPLLRPLRRDSAAHLRYLFDFVVAPWNRWLDPRTRREAALVVLGGGAGLSIRGVAERMRSRHPELYRDERPDVTMRRIYRLSARLQPERRAFKANARRKGDRSFTARG